MLSHHTKKTRSLSSLLVTVLLLGLATMLAPLTKAQTGHVMNGVGPIDQSMAGAGIVIEARLGQTRVRRLTSASGEAQFADLVPGEWQLFAIGSTIPDGYTTSPDSALANVTPGSSFGVSFELKPVVRGIQMVSSGSASLGKSVRAGARAPVKVVTPGKEPVAQPGSPTDPKQGFPAAELPLNHIVQQGETLSHLARKYYQSTRHWVRVWQANAQLIPNPDIITVGAELLIPAFVQLTEKEHEALRAYAKGLQ